MADVWTRILEKLADRLTGAMSFRFSMQPVLASVVAIVAGLQDARLGKPPYLWAVLTEPAHRAVYCFARRRHSARRNSGSRQAMNETKLGLNDVLALDRHAVGE